MRFLLYAVLVFKNNSVTSVFFVIGLVNSCAFSGHRGIMMSIQKVLYYVKKETFPWKQWMN